MKKETILKLKAEKRDAFGKAVKKTQGQNKLAAVFYGPKEKNTPIFISFSDFKKVWKEAGESTVIKLDMEGKEKDVLIYGVDIDPVKNEPRHVDFYAADMTKEIIAEVPLEFEGVPSAVKNLGGILVKVIHSIEVEALPKNLPQEIVVDVSGMDSLESKIVLGDLKVADGVKVLGNMEDAVALIDVPKEEVVEEVAPGIADIEVLTEKKKEEKSDDRGGEK